jgi:hypothetical protein
VHEAVQGGGIHDGVAGEDVAPVAQGFVGGDDGSGEVLAVSCTVPRPRPQESLTPKTAAESAVRAGPNPEVKNGASTAQQKKATNPWSGT